MLAGLLGAHAATAYKPTCRSSTGAIVQCTGNLDNTQAPTAIAASSLTGTVGVTQGGTGTTSYTGNGAIVADASGTALTSTAAPTAAGQYLLWDGVQWIPGIQTGSVYYFRRDASDIVGYEQITQTPQVGAEKTASTTLNNASGTVVFDPYATNAGEPGLTQLFAGTWSFEIYAQVSSTAGGNTTNIVLQVFKRTTGGTETLLFSTSSPALDSTSPKLYSWLYTQAADIPVDITDRLVVKVAATNSSGSNRTVTFYYEGTTRYSHFHPPFLSMIDAGSLVTIGGAQTITGTKTFSSPPVMSGASVTTATLPGSALTASSVATSKITGGTANRVLYDNGTNASWTAAPSSATSFLRGSSPPAFDLVNLNTDTAGVVPTAKGGTNLSSFTGGALLYASDTTTISQLGPCSSSQFVGSNGTTPTCSALPTATTGSGSLSTAQYDITTTNTFEDIGLSASLPSAGTYLVSADVRTFCQTSGSPPGYVTCKLYNSTDAADVTNSERFGAVDYTNNGSTDTLPIREVITIAAGKTIKVYCKTNSGPTFVNRGAASDANGRSRISYVKLSS